MQGPLRGLQTIVRRNEYGVQIFLRLAEQCWDYSILVPDAKITEHPLFSVLVPPADDEAGIARTVESLLSQTCQSFELVLAATAETAGHLRRALNFTACGRVRTHLVPPETAPAGIVEHLRRLCRGDYLVQVEAGGWLREDLLAEMAKSIPVTHGGAATELCGRGGDWSLSTLNRDEPSVGGGGGAAGGIRLYHIGRMPAEANRPTGFLPFPKERRHAPAAWAGTPLPGHISVVAAAAAEALSAPTTAPAPGPLRPNGEIRNPKICGFTFDSGPHPTLTYRVLDALDEAGMKGSFFLVGAQARLRPDVVRRIVATGHEVGVQGYDYEDLSRCTYSTIAASVEKTIALISDVAGVAPRWFRPPFARCSALVREVCRLKALKPVGWHVSSEDWTGQHHHRTVSTVLAHGLLGAVVLFHDGCGDPWETARAVSVLGRIARASGTAGVTLSDLESLVSLPPLLSGEPTMNLAGYYA